MKTIATVCGVGYAPVGPGTLGSLVGLGISWLLKSNPIYQVWGSLAAIALGFWSAGPTAKILATPDPPKVVIDELAGMMVALATLPATWKVYLAGFLLFRFLDIVKPLGIRSVQCLPGSLGIMADDLLAGLLTHGVLRAALLFV